MAAFARGVNSPNVAKTVMNQKALSTIKSNRMVPYLWKPLSSEKNFILLLHFKTCVYNSLITSPYTYISVQCPIITVKVGNCKSVDTNL